MSRKTTMCSGILSLSLLLVGATNWAPDSPVADAAQTGDVEAVRELLRAGADVNAAQGDGMTALHHAARANHVELVELLLFAGAAVSPSTRLGGFTPLHLASHAGGTEVIQVLAGAGADVNQLTSTGVAPLHLAAESGSRSAVEALVSGGASLDVRDAYSGRTPLMFATAHHRMDVLEALIESGADVSLQTEVVDYAARSDQDNEERRRRNAVKAAERGEDPSAQRGRFPGFAPQQARQGAAAEPAQAADTAQVEEDAEDRAEPEDQEEEVEPDPDSPTRTAGSGAPAQAQSDSSQITVSPLSYSQLVGAQGGISALHYAARDGVVDAAVRLLDAGADINGVTGGDRTSPLLMAVINGNYDLAMMLLERGADPNLVSEDGVGPVFAVVNGRWALRTWYPQPTAWRQQETDYLTLMRALLEAGADPNVRVNTHIWYAAYNAGRMGVDFSGATPFWRAAYSLDVDAMRLLAEHGADPNIPTVKPASRRFGPPRPDSEDEEEETDPSGLPPVEPGGPGVPPLVAATGVGYGTSRVGQQHRTVPDGWLAAARFLIEEMGADVNGRDHDGYSAVHNAAARGDDELIRYLVENGADVTFVSRRGQTTVDMANGPQQRVQPFPSTIALLEGLGAVNNHNCQSCQ